MNLNDFFNAKVFKAFFIKKAAGILMQIAMKNQFNANCKETNAYPDHNAKSTALKKANEMLLLLLANYEV